MCADPSTLYDRQRLSLVAKSSRRQSLEVTSQGGVEVMCGGRRFYTKEEKLEWLQEYKSNLESELKGVTERIDELKH
jgi:hypothetical protein